MKNDSLRVQNPSECGWMATVQICKSWVLFPPNSSPVIPRGSAALPFPESLQTKQFAWQLDFKSPPCWGGHMKKAQSHRQEAADNSLIASKCAFIPEAELHLWRWQLFLENTNKRKRDGGGGVAIHTKGHQLMLSPAASPGAYCSTAPIREGWEAIWTRPQPGPGKCTSALTCYIKPGEVCGFDCSWLRSLQLIPLSSSHRCSERLPVQPLK